MFTERADRLWTAEVTAGTPSSRTSSPTTVGLVAGDTGAVLIDIGSGDGAGLREAAERTAGVPVTRVILTHAASNCLDELAAFGPVQVLAHESLADRLGGNTAVQAEIRPLVAIAAIDLGERRVEVIHPGRGHSDADLVVTVPGTSVVFVGGLLGDPPTYGPDSWPLDWAATLDQVIGLLSETSLVVASRGEPVDRDSVIMTRSAAAAIAHEIGDLITRGVPFSRAESEGNWAMPFAAIRDGVAAEWDRSGDSGPTQGRPLLPLI